MNRFENIFAQCRRENRKALVAYVTAGNPNLPVSEKLIRAVLESGADILELGVPFSDPMADGPVIQKAGQIALRAGTTLPDIIAMAGRLRQHTDKPMVLFSYYNVMLAYGLEKLARDCVANGIDAWLTVDVPLEEREEIRPTAERAGIVLIPLVSPATPPERMKTIVAGAQGFVYYITVKGVTGARTELPADLSEHLDTLRRLSPVPVVAGFGIATPEMAAMTGQYADGVVVGSAIVRIMEQYADHDQAIAATAAFVHSLADALK